MKAKSTIRTEMRRLRVVMCHSPSDALRARAYEAYTALQWVVENTSWTPAGLIKENWADEAYKYYLRGLTKDEA